MSGMTFDDLFTQVLKATYYAEQKILKALPKMAEASSNPELQRTFQQHQRETEGQIRRLEQVFGALGQEPEAEKCPVINSMIDTCESLISHSEPGPVRDAGLIFCGQNVEHYEMAHYGTLIAWAREAGRQTVVNLLNETLQEEKNADSILNQMAKGDINRQAATLRQAA